MFLELHKKVIYEKSYLEILVFDIHLLSGICFKIHAHALDVNLNVLILTPYIFNEARSCQLFFRIMAHLRNIALNWQEI